MHAAPGRAVVTRENVPPAGTVHNGRLAERGSERTKRRAAAPVSSPTGRICRASACTSPKPLSQRSGSGTFRSVTEPSAASTTTSPDPTLSSTGPLIAALASTPRIASLKSTFVVPDATGGSASASGSRSSRECTPQQEEKDSNLSRSQLLVTTGSRRLARTLPERK
jgi:hypothetical protein